MECGIPWKYLYMWTNPTFCKLLTIETIVIAYCNLCLCRNVDDRRYYIYLWLFVCLSVEQLRPETWLRWPNIFMSSFIKKSCYVVTILLLTVFYFYVSTERSSFTPEINQQTISNHNAHAENPKKLKRILYWNDYYGSRNFGFCCGRGPYIKHKCLNSQCYTSKDRKEDLESFDAIVFHGRSLDIKDVPKIRYTKTRHIF